jgi:hypothetical protein
MSARREVRTPRIAADGSLDPGALADLGDRWILSWLRDRLAGNDPYWPLDRRIDEDPDAKVVALVRSAGSLHPASRSIGRASLRLFEEVAKQPAEPPAFFASLLRVCQRVRLPDVEPWFSAFVGELALHPREAEAQWGKGPTLEVLYAAIQQLRGAPGSRVHASWQRLLTSPNYTTHALIALSTSFNEEMEHLSAWWHACPPGDRRRELRQGITRAWKLEGTESLREILTGKWSALPANLRGTINQILIELKLAPIGLHSAESVCRAIGNAGQRPELVLGREAERHMALHGS